MRKRLIDTLMDVIEAERVARALRQEHGLAAEHRCEVLAAELAPRDPQREQLEDVRRALRWI